MVSSTAFLSTAASQMCWLQPSSFPEGISTGYYRSSDPTFLWGPTWELSFHRLQKIADKVIGNTMTLDRDALFFLEFILDPVQLQEVLHKECELFLNILSVSHPKDLKCLCFITLDLHDKAQVILSSIRAGR